jgi:hypothetical protein
MGFAQSTLSAQQANSAGTDHAGKANALAKPAQPGNQALLGRIQAKLSVGASNDPLEHEADAVADRIMRMPAAVSGRSPPVISRKCSSCEAEEKTIQRKAGDAGAPSASLAEQAAGSLSHSSMPLPPAQRAYFEDRFGRDFSGVRIHAHDRADSAAQAIRARAFTLGRDIGFARGEYAPGTDRGNRLLAHELTHVVQQASPTAPAADTIRRDDNDQVDPAPAPEQTNDADRDPDREKDTTVVYGRVEKVIVSCKDHKIGIQTRSETIFYGLPTCDTSIPPGEYIADVSVHEGHKQTAKKTNTDPDLVELTIQGKESKRGIFGGGYTRLKDQPSPAELLKDQDKVSVSYNNGDDTDPWGVKMTECDWALAPRRVFAGDQKDVDLTDHLPKAIHLSWDLADVGFADVVLKLSIEPEASMHYAYRDGVLDQICLTPSLRHGLAGHAHFMTSGAAEVHFGIKIAGEIDLQALHFIDVVSAKAELKLKLDAKVENPIDLEVEIQGQKKLFDDPTIGLKTDIELAALVGLQASVDGKADLSFLGYSLWEGEAPDFAKASLDYGWAGGLTFDESFLPQPMLGTFTKATPGQIKHGELRGKAPKKPSKKKDDSIPVGDLVKSWITGPHGEIERDGSSCDKALPIHWFKPKTDLLYPHALKFNAPGTDPDMIERDSEPTLVSHSEVDNPAYPHARDPIPGPNWIGVNSDNWVETGVWTDCFEADRSQKSRIASREFANVLKGLQATTEDGTPISSREEQMDHVRELQFGGMDDFSNLWPFSKDANMSAGSLHEKQVAAYEEMFDHRPHLQYTIGGIGLDPDKRRKVEKMKV